MRQIFVLVMMLGLIVIPCLGERDAMALAEPAAKPISFNSKLGLRVMMWRDGTLPKELGVTPATVPVEIPQGAIWWVESGGRAPAEFDAVVEEVRSRGLPGLGTPYGRNVDLTKLKGLKELKTLSLPWQDLGAQRLAPIGELAGLQSLNLDGLRNANAADFATLKKLKGLKRLDISNCSDVADEHLAHLKELKALQWLNLSGCHRMTDAGVSHLKELKALQWLNLSSCMDITDAGVAHLKELKALQSLDLNGCSRITDAGVAHLKELTSLQWLDLSGCRMITDVGVAHINEIKSLRTLFLNNCPGITQAGKATTRRFR